MSMDKNFEYGNVIFNNKVYNFEKKQELAKKICNKIKDNDVIGFGSGTTSYITACEIAKKVKKII